MHKKFTEVDGMSQECTKRWWKALQMNGKLMKCTADARNVEKVDVRSRCCTKSSPTILVPSIPQVFKQLSWVEQPRTQEIFSYDPSSLNYSLVQAVQQCWSTSNSWKILLCSLYSQLLGSSSSSAWLNFLELMKKSPPIFVLSITW